MKNLQSSLKLCGHWHGLLLLLLITWFLISTAYHAAIAPSPGITGCDFRIFFEAARRLNQGEPLYLFRPAGDTYVYSPLVAIVLRPLARLDFDHALKLWFFVPATCLLLGIGFYSMAARLTWKHVIPAALMLLVSFRFWPTTMNFGMGQANFVLLLLVCAMLFADSRDNMLAVALLIALAALIKTWMIGLVMYPVLRRDWRAVALTFAAYGAGLAALFTLVGWREWATFSKLTSGYATQKVGQIAAMQSIPGFARLHFVPNNLVSPVVESTLVFRLVVAAGFLILLGGLFCVWRRKPAPGSHESRLQFAFVMLSLLLMVPACTNEYYVLALPLFWTFLVPGQKGEYKIPSLAIAGSLAVYLLFTRGWPTYPPIPEAYQHGLKSFLVSANFLAAMVLWLITLGTLRKTERSPAPAGAA